MPGLGGRFSTAVKAKVSKLLDRAEDPAELLDPELDIAAGIEALRAMLAARDGTSALNL
jgi:hypothetical protein